MAQPASNPKIEELRFRLKTDPKSRLFYQLAEELRRAGASAEAEQVLRSGLTVYPTYLAAWVSLGRVLRELKNEGGAVEALNTAMQLDPGNVVAARLLADAHLALGDKLEAIKKYKLVHALMPGDEDLQNTIEQLDRELNPAPALATDVPATEPRREGPAEQAADWKARPDELSFAESPDTQWRPEDSSQEESPFDKTMPPFDQDTGDLEPMSAGHDESPFEEPLDTALASTFEIERPAGMHIDVGPPYADDPAPLEAGTGASGSDAVVFENAALGDDPVFDEEPGEPQQAEEVTETSTMADLYARQGLHNEARHIYEHILAREPGNVEVRAKLDAITPRVNPSIDRLERWLTKVGRKEVGRV